MASVPWPSGNVRAKSHTNSRLRLRHFVQKGAILQTLEFNVSQLEYDIGQIHHDYITVEILCAHLCDYRIKYEGVISKNAF